MTYVTIDENTPNGKRLMAEIRRMRKGVVIHDKPNDETRKALKEAKAGVGVKKVKNFSTWLDKVWAE